MPGIVTNIHLAASVMPNAPPEAWLGAALPDLMAMYRDIRTQAIPPKRFLGDEALATGIRMHGMLYRAHEENMIASEVRWLAFGSMLEAQGTKDKRRAGAYVEAATDLLLDGLVVQRADARQQAGHVARRINEQDNPFEVLGPPEFVTFVRGYFERQRWESYHDSGKVAEIIIKRFAARRHSDLDIPEGDKSALAEMVKEHQPRLERRRDKILAPTRRQLANRLISLAARA